MSRRVKPGPATTKNSQLQDSQKTKHKCTQWRWQTEFSPSPNLARLAGKCVRVCVHSTGIVQRTRTATRRWGGGWRREKDRCGGGLSPVQKLWRKKPNDKRAKDRWINHNDNSDEKRVITIVIDVWMEDGGDDNDSGGVRVSSE